MVLQLFFILKLRVVLKLSVKILICFTFPLETFVLLKRTGVIKRVIKAEMPMIDPKQRKKGFFNSRLVHPLHFEAALSCCLLMI